MAFYAKNLKIFSKNNISKYFNKNRKIFYNYPMPVVFIFAVKFSLDPLREQGGAQGI
jgi:hypothetical protein